MGLVNRAYNAIADMHWSVLAGLALGHALLSWLLLRVSGEAELSRPVSYIYWYATTAYTVGYGDLSPHTPAGRMVTAFWIFPGAIAVFTTAIAKTLSGVGDVWRRRRLGKGDYSRMSDSIVLIGFNPVRTPRMIDELCADLGEGCRIILLTRKGLDAPDDRVRYVRAQSLTSKADLIRAGVPAARRIIAYTDDDNETLAATLAAVALNPAAHVVCFFEELDNAALVKDHCPRVECVVGTGPELVVRAVQDPGASQVLTALVSNLDLQATLFSFPWPSGATLDYRGAALRFLDEGATLVALQKAGEVEPQFNRAPDSPVEDGDRLFYVSAARIAPGRIAKAS